MLFLLYFLVTFYSVSTRLKLLQKKKNMKNFEAPLNTHGAPPLKSASVSVFVSQYFSNKVHSCIEKARNVSYDAGNAAEKNTRASHMKLKIILQLKE